MYKLNQEVIDNIRELRLQGKSLGDISKQLTLSKSTVAIYLRKYCSDIPNTDRRTKSQKEKHEAVIKDRQRGLTVSELSIKHNLSKQTILKIVQLVELSDEAKDLIDRKRRDKSLLEYKYSEEDEVASLKNQIFELKAELRATKINEDILNIKNFKRGMVAELFVRYKLSRKGFLVSTPVLLEEGLDLLVTTSTKTYRCEIKATTSDIVGFIRTGYHEGSYKSEKYSEKDKIDIVILVDLIRENIFFIPFEISRRNMHIGEKSQFWEFKDNYSIFK